MATKVKIIGFDFKLANNLTIDDFYHQLVSSKNSSIKIGTFTYLLHVKIFNNYIVGAITCNKGDKKVLATSEQKTEGSNTPRQKVHQIDLDKDQKTTQATIFCIQPESKSGMFYTYNGGVNTVALVRLFTRIHDTSKKLLVHQESLAIEGQSQKNKTQCNKEAEKKYQGNFTFNLMVKQLDSKNILDEFSEISSLDITISSSVPPKSSAIFSSLSKLTNRLKIHATIPKSSQTYQNTKNTVLGCINGSEKDQIEALKIFGKSQIGIGLGANLGDNLDHFGEFFLDDFIGLLPPDYWDKFDSSEALKKLIDYMQKDQRRFPTPPNCNTWKRSEDKNSYLVDKT